MIHQKRPAPFIPPEYEIFPKDIWVFCIYFDMRFSEYVYILDF